MSYLNMLNLSNVWLRLAGSLKLYVSFAKEPYKRDYDRSHPIAPKPHTLNINFEANATAINSPINP